MTRETEIPEPTIFSAIPDSGSLDRRTASCGPCELSDNVWLALNRGGDNRTELFEPETAKKLAEEIVAAAVAVEARKAAG